MAYSPYSPDLAPCNYWLFAYVKDILRVNSLNQKIISTLLSLPLYIVQARMNRELHLFVYHIDGKRVWTVLVTTWNRGHICTHSETEKYQ
jgi:hypothetical protein